MAKTMLDAGTDVNLAARQRRDAADGGRLRRARPRSAALLLAKGADVNAVDRLQEERDDLRRRRGAHRDRPRCFSARGVDPNAVYHNDLTALMWAAGYGKTRP